MTHLQNGHYRLTPDIVPPEALEKQVAELSCEVDIYKQMLTDVTEQLHIAQRRADRSFWRIVKRFISRSGKRVARAPDKAVHAEAIKQCVETNLDSASIANRAAMIQNSTPPIVKH